MTVLDFDDRVECALWQGAWRAHDLYRAFGAKKKDGSPPEPSDFFGRELADIREYVKATTAPPAVSEEQSRKLALAQQQVLEAMMRRDHPEMVVGDPPPPEEVAPSPE